MNWKRTLLFSTLLCAVVILYYVKVGSMPLPKGSISLSPEKRQSLVLALKAGEHITHISIEPVKDFDQALGAAGGEHESGRQRAVFEKMDKGNWNITSPIKAPAESIVVNGFSTMLRLTNRIRELDFDPTNSGEYGFDDPERTVCIRTDEATEERCLLIGTTGAIGKGIYARWTDEEVVFLVEELFVHAFEKTPYSLRKKKLFRFRAGDVKSVHMRLPGHEFEIRREQSTWVMVRPEESMVGKRMVKELLAQLSGLYVKEFLDGESLDNPAFGLSRPERVVRVRLADDSKLTLVYGNEVPGQDAYYARQKDMVVPLLVSHGKLEKLEKTFLSLVA